MSVFYPFSGHCVLAAEGSCLLACSQSGTQQHNSISVILICLSCVQGDGSMITVEPGLIGGEINKILERHFKKGGHPIQYKIGPDPSSIDSAMVGGMVSNNSSGMCCGVSQNTYHTLKDMRVVFADGTVLDTADPKSRQSFMQVSHWSSWM